MILPQANAQFSESLNSLRMHLTGIGVVLGCERRRYYHKRRLKPLRNQNPFVRSSQVQLSFWGAEVDDSTASED